MYPSAFTIVSREHPGQVLAFGLEILRDGAEPDGAITYRRAPGEERAMIGQHRSADDALRLYSRMAPVSLVWADEIASVLAD